MFSIVESSLHPNFSALYDELNISNLYFHSMRKAIAKLKTIAPDFIVVEFFYGYGNNYAGVNISNLDVMLYTLQKYSPDSRVIVMVEKSQRDYVDELNKIIQLHTVLIQPVSAGQMKQAILG